MNAKTSKLLAKYAQRKDIPLKEMKREWLSLSQFAKDKKRQEILTDLTQK